MAEFERRQEEPLPSALAAVLQRCGVQREAERAEAAGVMDVNMESGGDSDGGGTANGDVEASRKTKRPQQSKEQLSYT